MTTGPTARRTFQGFFNAPQAAISGGAFQWNDVHTPQSPPDYSLARSVLARLTPLNAYQDQSEPFWIVYTPSGTRSFVLPTLPSSAPRASDNGYLVPDSTLGQTNSWHLGLYYLGLAPGTVDLASFELASTIPEVTQTAGDDVTLP